MSDPRRRDGRPGDRRGEAGRGSREPGTGQASAGPAFTCGMCGRRFREDRGQPACRACPLAGGCRHVRCPHCGHENPVSPGWVERLLELLRPDAGGEEKDSARKSDPPGGRP